eukprot:PhF_6_TR40645/c0_g1_i1/m.61033
MEFDLCVIRQVRVFHISTTATGETSKEICQGRVDVVPTMAGTEIRILHPTSGANIMGYKVDKTTEISTIEVQHQWRISWTDTTSYGCMVQVEFLTKQAMQGILQLITSLIRPEPIDLIADVNDSEQRFVSIVETLERNYEARPTEITKALVDSNVHQIILRSHNVSGNTLSRFVRIVFTINLAYVIEDIATTEDLLNATLRAAQNDKELTGSSSNIDHVQALNQERSKFINSFGLSEDVVSCIHRYETFCYLKDCVFPQLIGFGGLVSETSKQRHDMITAILKDDMYVAGLKELVDNKATPEVTRNRLRFLNGLLCQSQGCATALKFSPGLQLLSLSFGRALQQFLSIDPNIVGNILMSLSIICPITMRCLVFESTLPTASEGDGQRSMDSSLLASLIRYCTDSSYPCQDRSSINVQLISEVIITALDLTPSPPSPMNLERATAFRGYPNLDPDKINPDYFLQIFYGTNVIGSVLLGFMSSDNIVVALKLLEPCVRSHGTHGHEALKTCRVLQTLTALYKRVGLAPDIKLHVLSFFQFLLETRDEVLGKLLTESGALVAVVHSMINPSTPRSSARMGIFESTLCSLFEALRKNGSNDMLLSLFSSLQTANPTSSTSNDVHEVTQTLLERCPLAMKPILQKIVQKHERLVKKNSSGDQPAKRIKKK